MKRTSWSGYGRAIAAAALFGVVLIRATPTASAEVRRTGSEPWYLQPAADVRWRAQQLFDRALDKHLQLLRGDAMELYEQALALWDNPDIRWNLALVLDDLGKYLTAHQQLERVMRWDVALGAERLSEVRERMRVLETQRLARIEAVSDQPGADVRLDGQPWFRGAGRRSMLVIPGTHYVGATRSGYTPTTVSVAVAAGERYRVTLRMVVDHAIETRRWAMWAPWSVVTGGIAAAAVGGGFEWQARARRDAAARALARECQMTFTCQPARPPENDRAVTDNWVAIGAFATGGSAIAVGMVLAWLNQPRWQHPEATASPVELVSSVSSSEVEVSMRIRF